MAKSFKVVGTGRVVTGEEDTYKPKSFKVVGTGEVFNGTGTKIQTQSQSQSNNPSPVSHPGGNNSVSMASADLGGGLAKKTITKGTGNINYNNPDILKPLPYAVSSFMPRQDDVAKVETNNRYLNNGLPLAGLSNTSAQAYKDKATQLKEQIAEESKKLTPYGKVSSTMMAATYTQPTQTNPKVGIMGTAPTVVTPTQQDVIGRKIENMKGELAQAQNAGYMVDYTNQWIALLQRPDAEDIKQKLARMATLKDSFGTDYGQNVAAMNEYLRIKGSLEKLNINAEGLADWLQRNKDYIDASLKVQAAKEFATEKPGLASIASVGQNLVSGQGGIQGVAQVGMNANSGEYRPINIYGEAFDASREKQVIRGTVGENIAEKHGSAAKYLYDIGMSMADSGATALIGGVTHIGSAASIILGSAVASDTMMNVVERGGSTEQAVTAGVMAGAAEAIFEKMSLDKFLDKLKNTNAIGIKAHLKNMGLQALTEASEETFTELANIFADEAVMGSLSELNEMRKNGASEAAILGEAAKRVGLAALGGFLSGGVFGGVGSISNRTSTSLRERRVINAFEDLTGAKVETKDKLGRANSVYDEEGNVTLGGDSFLRVHNALAHEGGHLLKQRDRAAWDGILKIASDNLTAEQRATFEEKLARSGYDVTNEELVQEEMVSLYLQQCMSDISKFEELVGVDRTLAQKIVDFLDDIVRKVTNQHSYGTNLEYDSLRNKLGDMTGVEETIAAMKQALAGVKSVDPQANADYIASLPQQAQPSLVQQYAGQQITNKQATALLNDSAAVEEMTKAGVNLEGTASQRRNAVKNYVAHPQNPEMDTLMEEVGKKFSLKSMRYDIDDGQMQRDLVESGVFTEEEAQGFIDNVNALMDKIMQKANFLDMNEADNKEDRTFKAYKPNSDPLYQVSLDFSTLCKKRIITQAIIERLNVAHGKALDGNTQFAIAEKLRQLQSEYEGLQVACAICYVEAARLKSPKVINQFLGDRRSALVTQYAKDSAENRAAAKAAADAVKMSVGLDGKASKNDLKAIGGTALANAATNASKAVRDNYKPTPEQEATIRRAEAMDAEMFLTADGLAKLSKEEPEIYKAFTSKVRSATRSKALEGHVAYYYGDSASEVSDTLIEAMNKENGLRHQSWSDFELVHLLDEITAITEMSIRGAKMHTYTKVPEMVTVVGDTGMMINLSLIPEGHLGMDESGNLIFSSTEGMDIETARELRNRYGTTAGTICIGINDLQIQKLLDAEDIDYVIPYHISGLTKHLRKIAGINQWVNYTATQNETKLAGLPKAGQTDWHKKPNFSDWFTPEIYNQSKPGIEIMRDAAENYKRICAERGLKPKFYDKFGSHPNYWKLLVDRKMIDDNGNIIIQQAVKPNFDWDAIGQMVEQAEDPHMEDLIDTLAGEITKSMESGEIAAIAKNSQSVKKAQQMMDKLDAEDYLAANPTEGLSTNQKFSLKADPLYYLGTESNYKPVSRFATSAPKKPQESALPRAGEVNGGQRKTTTQSKFGGNTVGAAQPNPGTYANLQTEHGVVDPGENPSRMIDMPKKDANGQVNSLFARTVAESESMPTEMVPEWEEAVASGAFSHEVATDKAANRHAERELGKGWDHAMRQWNAVSEGTKIATKNDLALGQLLLANAMKDGDTQTAMKLTAELCAEATRAGQAVQSFRLLKKMTPEGMLYYLQKTVNNLNEDFEGRKGFEKIKIDEGLAERLTKATTREEMDAVVDDIKKDIAAQTPVTWYDKWNAWRYVSMLGNPTTQVRNILGNALFLPVVKTKNLIATGIEAAVKKTGHLPYATKAVLNAKKDKSLLDFADKDFDNVVQEIQGGGKYSDKDDVMSKRQIFRNKFLEGWRTLTNKAMDKGDEIFSHQHYKASLAQYMKANNLTPENITPEQLNKARSYAVQEAQRATYRDASSVASLINRAKRTLANTANNKDNDLGKRAAARAGEFLLEGFVPFTKTPVNIVKRGIEYSPVGLVQGTVNLVRSVRGGDVDAAAAIDRIAAGLTGSGLLALGAWLASLGMVSGGPGEDDREEKYKGMLGGQDYALDLVDSTYTIDWLAPEALPFFTGVELYKEMQSKDGITLADTLGLISAMSDPIVELSMLSSMNNTFESLKYTQGDALSTVAGNLITSYLGQGVPTIGGKIARTLDETSRQTYYDPNKTGIIKSADVFRQKVQAKIPGAANALPERVDLWGRTEKNTGGNVVGRFFYNMLSPGYAEPKNVTKVDEELLRLAEATSDSNVYPEAAGKTFKVGGETVKLNSKQYTQFAKTKGQTAFDILEAAVDSSTYKKMTDAEKAEFVKDVYEYANAKAKAEVSKYQLDGKNAKIAQAEAKGIKPAQFLTITGAYDKDGNGSVTQEEAKAVLDKSGLTKAQKAYLWKLQNKSWKNNPYN